MRKLKIGREYYRRELHTIFKCPSNFKPGEGAWGVQRIVSVPNQANDFIFFETFDQDQALGNIVSRISENGILTWHSHPSQSLKNNMVANWIEHDEEVDTIHLFVNKSRKEKYTYLGTLSYLTHDNERQNPVWFKFQLNNFELDEGLLPFILIEQKSLRSYSRNKIYDNLEQREVPTNSSGEGLTTLKFENTILPNYLDKELEDLNLRLAGEKLVLRHEKERLEKKGLSDLAERVVLSKNLKEEKAGFDIRSFDTLGSEIFIEVKTTRGNSLSPFQASHIEVNFSKEKAQSYRLYRIYEYNDNLNSAKYYTLHGAIDETISLAPVSFYGLPKK